MAADILFGHRRSWSVQHAAFAEMMTRARAECDRSETHIVELFAFADVVSCHNLDSYADASIRRKLTERLRSAAIEWDKYLTANPETDPDTIKSIQKLIGLLDQFLAERCA